MLAALPNRGLQRGVMACEYRRRDIERVGKLRNRQEAGQLRAASQYRPVIGFSSSTPSSWRSALSTKEKLPSVTGNTARTASAIMARSSASYCSPATPRGSFYIGRINGNDMIMPDYAISKRHAIIDIEDGKYYLRDAGSTNGTKINGSRLAKKRVMLKDKDVIGFARYEFTFLYPKSLYKMLHEVKS